MKKIIVLKYGEIGLKGKNRIFFETQLIKNFCVAANVDRQLLKSERGRIYIEIDDSDTEKRCLETLPKVFGIVGFSSGFSFEPSQFSFLKEHLIALLKKEEKTFRFRVTTRRVHDHLNVSSMKIDAQVGAYILEIFPTWKVDLHTPELTVFIELRETRLLLYLSQHSGKGPGGLPVGVSGRGLLLLSGGIDSPIAGWSMLKRGLSWDAVYFHSFPYTGEKTKLKVKDLLKTLRPWSLPEISLYVPDFTETQETINRLCPKGLWTVLHRRMMLRITEQIAFGKSLTTTQYDAIITGDNLGQVASQTVHNLAVVEKATTFPVLRPLLAWDKCEIMNLAKRIQTLTISNRPYPDCCAIFTAAHPVTKARLSDVLAAEEILDIPSLIQGALTRALVEKIK